MSYQKEVTAAAEIAREAGNLAVKIREGNIGVESKADESPVTIADRACEKLIVEGLRRAFPEDGLLGEEGAARESANGRRWIIDPIDGTRDFIRGTRAWTILIGLEKDHKIVAGCEYFPATGEMFTAGSGDGAFWDGRPMHASSITKKSEALLCCNGIGFMHRYPFAANFLDWVSEFWTVRSTGGCLDAMLVASFITFSTSDWHGVTLHENFTYSKAMGTGAVAQVTSEYTVNDAFDLEKNYGVQAFNRKFVFNMYGVWQTPWYKDQRELIGRLVGGWSIAPIWTMGNGDPLACQTINNNIYYGSQEFGGSDDVGYGSNAQCIFTSKYNAGVHSHYGVTGGTDPYGNTIGDYTAGSTVASEVNRFANPVAVYDQVRNPILGIDTRTPGVGPIIGMPYWNVDMSVQKDFRVVSHAVVQLSFIFTNVFNHNVMADPYLSTGYSDGWGVQSGQQNANRNMEFGVRTSW